MFRNILRNVIKKLQRSSIYNSEDTKSFSSYYPIHYPSSILVRLTLQHHFKRQKRKESNNRIGGNRYKNIAIKKKTESKRYCKYRQELLKRNKQKKRIYEKCVMSFCLS